MKITKPPCFLKNVGLTYKRPEEATVVLEYDGGEDHGEGRRREEDGRGIPQG